MRASSVRVGILTLVLLASGTTAASARSDPAPEGATGWAVVAVGGSHACGIKQSGQLFCWGRDHHGQLGNGGGATDRAVPVPIASLVTDWVAVNAGGNHTCALRSSGRLYCWGDNRSGQVGFGSGNLTRTTPVQVSGSRTDWASVSLGEEHSCATRTTGRLYCWGDNGYGELGTGAPRRNATAPVQVNGAHTDWDIVTAARFHTCGRRTTGRLYCWGKDSSGEGGNGSGTRSDRLIPVQVAGSHTDWTSVAAGGQHSCGRRSSGELSCWGWNLNGFLGDGTTTNRHSPRLVAGGFSDWELVDAAGTTLEDAAPFISGHTCATRATTLYCWGRDDNGQMGAGPGETSSATPVPAAAPTGWTAVSVGGESSCGLRGTKLYCWGRDHHGQVGNGLPRADVGAPVELPA